MASIYKEGQGKCNEFDANQIVVRYGNEGMTYFTGEFTQTGEGIFAAFPNKDKHLSPIIQVDKNSPLAS